MKKERTSGYPWMIISLMFFITIVNFVDRCAISYVIDPLKAEFHLTDTQFGIILSGFSVGYILLSSLGGWLVDQFGSRVVWPLAALIWSLSIGLLGLATGLVSFFALRFLLGVAEGPHYPAVSRTVQNWVPKENRARALSLSLAAVPISSCIGSPIISYLVADFGWRWMFVLISLAGMVWAVLWFLFFKDRPNMPSAVNAKETKFLSSPTEIHKNNCRYILTHPTLLANNIAYISFGFMVFFATLWLPGYLSSQFNLNLKSIGWYLTLPWLTASICMLFGGFLSDWLYKKTKSYRLSHSHIIWISQLFSAICFLLLSQNHSLAFTITFLSLGVGLGFLPFSLFFNINVEVGKKDAGFAQGITSTYFSLAGIIAPFLTGWLVDRTGNFKAAFLLLGGVIVFTVFVVLLFHHPDQKSNEDLANALAESAPV
jgi:sugar phosphate permease